MRSSNKREITFNTQLEPVVNHRIFSPRRRHKTNQVSIDICCFGCCRGVRLPYSAICSEIQATDESP